MPQTVVTDLGEAGIALIFFLKILGYQDGVAAGQGFDHILETVLENGAKRVATFVSILHPIRMAHRPCLPCYPRDSVYQKCGSGGEVQY